MELSDKLFFSPRGWGGMWWKLLEVLAVFLTWCCWAHNWHEGESREVPRMQNVGRRCSQNCRGRARLAPPLHLALVGVSTLAPHLVGTKAVWSPCSCLASRAAVEIWAALGWEGVVLFSATSGLLGSCGSHRRRGC